MAAFPGFLRLGLQAGFCQAKPRGAAPGSVSLLAWSWHGLRPSAGEGCHLKLWDPPPLCHTGLAGPAIPLCVCAALKVSDSQGPLHQSTVWPALLRKVFPGVLFISCNPNGICRSVPTCVVVSISWARLTLAQLGQERCEGLSDVLPAVERGDQGVTMSPRTCA